MSSENLLIKSSARNLLRFIPTPAVEYGGGGILSGNSTAYVWASGIVLVNGGQAGTYMQLLYFSELSIEVMSFINVVSRISDGYLQFDVLIFLT